MCQNFAPFLCVEVDVDLDDYSPADVDRLNVLALEYGVAASSFSKLVFSFTLETMDYQSAIKPLHLNTHAKNNELVC